MLPETCSMPRLKLTKTAIDALPTPTEEVVYWDAGSPGFGVKVTSKGRKVFALARMSAMCRSRHSRSAVWGAAKYPLHMGSTYGARAISLAPDAASLAPR